MRLSIFIASIFIAKSINSTVFAIVPIWFITIMVFVFLLMDLFELTKEEN